MANTLYVSTIEKASGDPVDFTGQAAAKVHLTYDGVANTIEDSLNISSVTDSATGQYINNYTNSFSDANHTDQATNNGTHCLVNNTGAPTTSLSYTEHGNGSFGAYVDPSYTSFTSWGDLA